MRMHPQVLAAAADLSIYLQRKRKLEEEQQRSLRSIQELVLSPQPSADDTRRLTGDSASHPEAGRMENESASLVMDLRWVPNWRQNWSILTG